MHQLRLESSNTARHYRLAATQSPTPQEALRCSHRTESTHVGILVALYMTHSAPDYSISTMIEDFG